MALCIENIDQTRNNMVAGKNVRRVGISSESAERRLSVLVVDDDPVIQKIHKMMLTKFKIISHTQVVKNGKQAVDLHHCGAIFDIILMDMEMPIMNGIQVCTCTDMQEYHTYIDMYIYLFIFLVYF